MGQGQVAFRSFFCILLHFCTACSVYACECVSNNPKLVSTEKKATAVLLGASAASLFPLCKKEGRVGGWKNLCQRLAVEKTLAALSRRQPHFTQGHHTRTSARSKRHIGTYAPGRPRSPQPCCCYCGCDHLRTRRDSAPRVGAVRGASNPALESSG